MFFVPSAKPKKGSNNINIRRENSMKRIVVLLLCSSVLILSLTGCKNSSNSDTTINNIAEYLVQDNLIQVEQLPWGISSKEARAVIGDIDENFLQWTAGTSHLRPIEQITFKELDLTTDIIFYYFDSDDQLIDAIYDFEFSDEEQARSKMVDLIAIFHNNLPYTYDYRYDDKSRQIGVYKDDSIIPEMIAVPVAKWTDEADTILKIMLEPVDGVFHLSISIGTNGHTVY